jgi:methylenetetrahydrofolate--tRNA-(uracil-5-)-methyltransferase
MNKIHVIGAGLAGCEAAWQISKLGIDVVLHEMKPEKKSPAHTADGFAELVCSNSLRSDRLSNAAGLLKEEMRLLDSLIMHAADATSVPAGGALAVNRTDFSNYITNEIKNNPYITVANKEITDISAFGDEIVIIATGPLPSDALLKSLSEITGVHYLNFFDAAAPIVSAESIGMSKAFWASRYDRGSDYLNCPMTEEEYGAFYRELTEAECAPLRDFENNVFEGCMPIEVMAKRGYQTMRFGPLKPKGVVHPGTGREPYAVVQLRREDERGTMYNMVGFQTHLKWGEQKRVFSMIPGLENAEFLRYGVMHKNTFIDSPRLLNEKYRMRDKENMYFAGQITGVEGYIESASSGLLAGIFAAAGALGVSAPVFSDATAIGALAAYISNQSVVNFQPMNINYGIMKPCDQKISNKEKKNLYLSERSLEEIKCLREQQSLLSRKTANVR